MEKKVIKAAIYTRKSSEEGLDMAFVPWMANKRRLLSFAQFEREVTGERIRDLNLGAGMDKGNTVLKRDEKEQNRNALQVLTYPEQSQKIISLVHRGP